MATQTPSATTIIPEPGPETRPPMVMVTCAGRSGSKWMLRLLDFHPQTLCRNEPERFSPWLKDPSLADWDAWYRRAMDLGPMIGFVDREPAMPKDHMRAWVRRIRPDRLLYRPTVQKLLGRYPEARYPGVFYDPDAIASAQRVLKVINARHFMRRALVETDHFPIVHMIRHPGGMLNSWLNRFAPTQDQTGLLETQRGILKNIHREDPAFLEISGPADGKGLSELKLWCWRHAQEELLALGRRHPRYASVVFEQLSEDPITLMEPIYALCGLEYTDAVRSLIHDETRQSRSIASAWKNKLTAEQVEQVEQVLDGSVVGALL